jgi:hypothetical protein
METGRMAVSVEDAEQWGRATRAGEDYLPELRELALHALTEALAYRSRGPLRERLPRQQSEVAALERATRSFHGYHPCLLPSMMQTSEYARKVYEASHPESGEELAPAITARLDRQALLFDRQHQFEFVVPEVALRWHFGVRSVQLGALDRVRQVAVMPNVWLGVLPLAAGTPVWHSHGFNLYDDVEDGDPVVHVGALTTMLNLSDPADIERYRQAFARLREACLTGEPALALIAKVMSDISA